MSMNKTCPISNFTSEEVLGRHELHLYLKTRDVTSLVRRETLDLNGQGFTIWGIPGPHEITDLKTCDSKKLSRFKNALSLTAIFIPLLSQCS